LRICRNNNQDLEQVILGHLNKIKAMQNKEEYLNSEIKKNNNDILTLQNKVRDLEKVREA